MADGQDDDTTDLAYRLRVRSSLIMLLPHQLTDDELEITKLLDEAAAEIEYLRKELAQVSKP